MKTGILIVIASLLLLPAGAAEVSLVASPGEGAKNWPRWRGPSGQGLVTGEGYPVRWSAEEKVLWKVPVPGLGNSSPIVWGDRIFLTASTPDGKSRGIIAFRRTDGERLWQALAPEAPPEGTHRKNGLASSTPTTDGERVYAYLGNHGVLAVDFEGKQVWHRSLGRFEAYHGTASSPLLHGDALIVVQDHGGRSFIAALDRKTGEELWRTDRPSQVGWSTPIAIRAGDREADCSGRRGATPSRPSRRPSWGTACSSLPRAARGRRSRSAPAGRET
jgi:outer membrane protein assembly factor BamB